jgi:hypothetical protein
MISLEMISGRLKANMVWQKAHSTAIIEPVRAAGHYGNALAATVALNFGDILRTLLEKEADLFANDEHG